MADPELWEGSEIRKGGGVPNSKLCQNKQNTLFCKPVSGAGVPRNHLDPPLSS